jgi:hypothetical protein
MSEPGTPMDRLRARQQQLAALRADLLSGEEHRRTSGLKQLYIELTASGELWFDRLGHVAAIDGAEGFEAGLVELVLVLSFDSWPPTDDES